MSEMKPPTPRRGSHRIAMFALVGVAAVAALPASVGTARTIDRGCVRIAKPAANQSFQRGQVVFQVWNTSACPKEARERKIEVQIERVPARGTPNAPSMSAKFHVYKAGIGKNLTALNNYVGGIPGTYRVRARKDDTPGWGSYTPWVVFRVTLPLPGAGKLNPVPIPKPGQ